MIQVCIYVYKVIVLISLLFLFLLKSLCSLRVKSLGTCVIISLGKFSRSKIWIQSSGKDTYLNKNFSISILVITNGFDFFLLLLSDLIKIWPF
jgi:hypothetical protein